ncbi:hypothetical protein [Myxococcus phage Mx1]|nr:hypothetical protein [Myxococcus phage Mx1]
MNKDKIVECLDKERAYDLSKEIRPERGFYQESDSYALYRIEALEENHARLLIVLKKSGVLSVNDILESLGY